MTGFGRRALTLCMALWLLCAPAQALGEALNVLLIGVDTAAPGQRGRSDTMMLARVDASAGEIKLVSFLRDLYVPIPGHGKTRLNAAYFHGGEALLKEVLQKQFDLSVDRTVTVDFSVLREVVDELGGIEMDVTEAERKHLNRLLQEAGQEGEQLEQAGRQRLNGNQALMYSRIRKLDSDFQRTSRQQAVISAMLQAMSRMSRWELFKLAVKKLDSVQTDLTLGDMTRLAPLFGKLGTMTLKTAHVPFDGTFSEETVNGMMVLSADLGVNRRRLEGFLE